jgi:hypothetical protein
VYVVAASWPGIQRLWYLRAFRGGTVRIREVRRLVGAYFWRYAVLGFVLLVPAGAVFAIVFQLGRAAGRVALIVMFLAIDVALTFVTPALAFTTRRVRIALRVGLDMIADDWPRCVWYVAAPPLAVTLISQLGVAAGSVDGLRLAVGVVVGLLGLVCKGAVATFYLRRWPTGPDGAAFADANIPLPVSGRRRTDPPRRPDRHGV